MQPENKISSKIVSPSFISNRRTTYKNQILSVAHRSSLPVANPHDLANKSGTPASRSAIPHKLDILFGRRCRSSLPAAQRLEPSASSETSLVECKAGESDTTLPLEITSRRRSCSEARKVPFKRSSGESTPPAIDFQKWSSVPWDAVEPKTPLIIDINSSPGSSDGSSDSSPVFLGCKCSSMKPNETSDTKLDTSDISEGAIQNNPFQIPLSKTSSQIMNQTTTNKMPLIKSVFSFRAMINRFVRFFLKNRIFGLNISLDRAIQFRILLLTFYFVLHYFLLSVGVWSSSIFLSPPERPSLTRLLESSTAGAPLYFSTRALSRLDFFFSLVHPHVDGHKQLNCSMVTAMTNSLACTVTEWVVLLWLYSSASPQRKSNFFGLLTAIVFFVNVTGALWGGLSHKTVLFPDLWGYIWERVESMVSRGSVERVVYRYAFLKDLFPPLNLNFIKAESLLAPFAHLTWGGMLVLPALYSMNALDVVGCLMTVIIILRFLKPTHLVVPLLILVTILGIGSQFLCSIPTPDANDGHWLNNNTNHAWNSGPRVHPVYITKYVPMADGLELAVDIYLPVPIVRDVIECISDGSRRQWYEQKLELPRATEKPFCSLGKCLFERRCTGQNESGSEADLNIDNSSYAQFQNASSRSKSRHSHTKPLKYLAPTVVMVTRYNRRMTVRWPFTFLSLWGDPAGRSTSSVWSWQFVDTLVTAGYVVVIADTRGTGASFGNRPVDFAPSELSDFVALSAWIRKQYWFDGHLASGGFSYDGMTGLHMAATSKLQAVLALFTPINVVHDLIQPGGMVCSAFVEDYTGLTAAFEETGSPRNHMLLDFSYEWQVTLGFVLTFGIAAPVKTREHSLMAAIEDHKDNWNMSAMVEVIHFTDDFVVLPAPKGVTSGESTKLPVSSFGITENIVNQIKSSKAAVYIVGGFCDSSSARGSARLFDKLQNSEMSNLILGPWTHTGRRNCSPYSTGSVPQFEVDMFLDCQMGRRCIHDPKSDNSSVHFLPVGSSKWFSSNTFPPTNVEELDFFFDERTELQFYQSTALAQSTASRLRRQLTSLPLNILENIKRLATGQMNISILKIFQLPPIWRAFNYWVSLLTNFEVSFFEMRAFNDPPARSSSYGLSMKKNTTHAKLGPYISEAVNAPSLITYRVDYDASTRGLSRWVIAKHPFRMTSISEREWAPSSGLKKADKSPSQFVNFPLWSGGTSTGDLLMFTSPQLKEGLLVVGSPLVRFSLNLTEEIHRRAGELQKEFFNSGKGIRINEAPPVPAMDVTVFGYLEDVDLETGEVHYVTEGRVLLSHRPHVATNLGLSGLQDWQWCIVPPMTSRWQNEQTLQQTPRLGSADVVYQKGNRAAHRFTVGGVECVVFTFEPVAWYFKENHALRLSLAGADRANFLWGRTQSKVDADFLDLSLLSAVKAGWERSKLRELRKRGLHIERPKLWHIPVNNEHHAAFLKLPILRETKS